jgi:hypothetical protein
MSDVEGRMLLRISIFSFVLIFSVGTIFSQQPDSISTESELKLDLWERGLVVQVARQKEMQMFFWCYEWSMFGAVLPGVYERGNYKEFSGILGNDGSSAELKSPHILLSAKARDTGVDLLLTVTNTSTNQWPEMASIIACFNPGKKIPDDKPTDNVLNPAKNLLFSDDEHQHTYYYGKSGFQLLKAREIHYQAKYSETIHSLHGNGFPWDKKWPTSADPAFKPIMIRESIDGLWSTGIAWEDSISSQGHNPWRCMHLSTRIGSLAPGATKTIKGKIYLMRGRKEKVLAQYLKDFPEK